MIVNLDIFISLEYDLMHLSADDEDNLEKCMTCTVKKGSMEPQKKFGG